MTLSPRYVADTEEAPFMASFSSRGPSRTDRGAMLKPDILAPGVNVFAPTTISTHSNDTGEVYSGTSMAAPHVAGIGALITSAHPE